MIIKLHEEEPCFLGYTGFIFFTILSLASLYKLYIHLISIDKTVKSEKLILNRNNLFNDVRYNIYNPRFQSKILPSHMNRIIICQQIIIIFKED